MSDPAATEAASASSDSTLPPTQGSQAMDDVGDHGTSQPSSQGSDAFIPQKPSYRKKKRAQQRGGSSRTSKQPRMSKNSRVSTTREKLYHCLNESQRDCVPGNIPNDYLFYGTVVGGGASAKTARKANWEVSFDFLPYGKKVVTLDRKKLIVLEKGQEEPTVDVSHFHDTVEEVAEKAKKKSPWQQSVDDFISQDKDDIADATLFEGKWDTGRQQKQCWEIRADDDPITESNFKPPEPPKLNIDPNAPLAETFFDKIFPDVAVRVRK